MKKVSFILAHYDDEVFCYSKILKHLSEGDKVKMHIVCGAETDPRKRIFEKNWDRSCVNYQLGNAEPFELNSYKNIDLNYLLENDCKVDIVYTHCINDLHIDHRLISEAVRVNTRPTRNKTKELYEINVIGSTEISSNFNIYQNITKNISKDKHSLIQKYEKDGFLKQETSSESIKIIDKANGIMVGLEEAERYKLIFKKE